MEEARAFCKANFGDLLVIEDNTERKFIWKYVRRSFIISDMRTMNVHYLLIFGLFKGFLWLPNSDSYNNHSLLHKFMAQNLYYGVN